MAPGFAALPMPEFDGISASEAPDLRKIKGLGLANLRKP